MEAWAVEFDYWEICDQVCINLFEKQPLAWQKAVEWSDRENEGKKRAAFVLMARLAVSDKNAPDDRFEPSFPLILCESTDGSQPCQKSRQLGAASDW